MTPRRAITVLFKLLVAIALGYCIATTLFVWFSGPAASAIGRPNERLPGAEAFDGNPQVQGCQLRRIASLQSD